MAVAEQASRAELTSTRTKLFYGFGSIAYGVKDNGFATILLPFYNLVLHLPPQWVGAALAIALAVDALLDPLVGHFSDNLRTRWGRRHPLMYASALPVAASYLLLWNPPHWSQQGLFLWLIGGAIVTRTFITFYEIPSSALVPELTDDYDERTSFLAYRVFFGWYGGMAMLTLAYFVFLRPTARYPVGQLNPQGYHEFGVVGAAVMAAAILISAWGTHRFIPLFKAPDGDGKSLLRYAREMLSTLKNKAFAILLSATLFTYMATGMVFALTFYINTYFWQFSNAQIGILNFAIFLAVMIAFVVSPAISRLMGKKRAAIAMFTVGAVITSTPLIAALSGHFFKPHDPRLLPVLFCVTAIGSALTIGTSIMVGAMIADVVEDSEIRTGRRSEGLFFAGNSFLQKTVSGLGLFASGELLSLVGFPSTAVPGQVDAAVVDRFALAYLVSIAVLYGLGFLVLSRFPIDRLRHHENLRTLAGEVGLAGAPVAADLEMEQMPARRPDPS